MAIVKQDGVTVKAVLARKHRIAMRRQRSGVLASLCEEEISTDGSMKRQRVALDDSEAEPRVVSSATADDTATKSSPEGILESIKKKKPHITGIKKLSRYDPGVEMTKVELKAWRKEARRVRNRESAAASRKKNRETVETLEVEVKGMQTKYDAALQYIIALENHLRRSEGTSSATFFPSSCVRQDLQEARKVSSEIKTTRQTVSRSQSPTPIVQIPHGIGPKDQTLQVIEEHRQQERRQWQLQFGNQPNKNTLTHPSRHFRSHPNILNTQKHIIDNTIIRPIACV